jgi:hypothetical protein
MRNFAITAMGRSGTKFLTKAMNRSQEWTVKHEPKPVKGSFSQIQRRFKREYYGEVNSYLRWHLPALVVAQKGIIIRNPKDIIFSAFNWKHSFSKDIVSLVNKGLVIVDRLAEENFIIRFENMTSNHGYLKDVMHHFGVCDVDVEAIDLTKKINASRKQKTWEEIPREVRGFASDTVQWFADKYGYEI